MHIRRKRDENVFIIQTQDQPSKHWITPRVESTVEKSSWALANTQVAAPFHTIRTITGITALHFK